MTGRQTPALPGPGERVYGVAELNKEVRLALERNYPLIWIEGEISNFRHFQASGHWYFTLKDSAAQVSAAMFRGQNRHIPFTPADGMQVLVLGQVSLYEARGSYQVIVRRMAEQGAGALHAAFQRLRERLAAEGLFHESRKRPLPTLPQRIGIVTSRDGAALRDILRILHRRHAGVFLASDQRPISAVAGHSRRRTHPLSKTQQSSLSLSPHRGSNQKSFPNLHLTRAMIRVLLPVLPRRNTGRCPT